MTPERLLQAQEAYDSVAELEPSRRAAALADICAGDDDLREQVERLLDLREKAKDFFQTLPPELQFATSAGSFVGKQVGPWRLVHEIGHGGMSVVYLAVRADDAFQKEVAVKLIWPAPAGAELVNRFRREREILAALDHPNIARLLDGGATEEGLHYLVMERVVGMPITDYCNARRLSIDDRLKLFLQICEAVQYAHRNLVVHRDLKPGNIFVTAGGVVKLLDFGIAKLLSPNDSIGQHTLRLMTLDYASPEQVRGEAITISSDVYSLGVALYELLTGRLPHKANAASLNEMARVICDEEPELPSARGVEPQNFAEGGAEKLRRRLKGDLDNIVLMALRKEATRRYSSAGQLSEDISRFLSNRPVIARRSTLCYRAVKFAHRHPLRVAAMFLLTIALAALMMAMFIRARDAEAETRRERRRLYEARMRQAGYDLEEGNFTRLRATLESYLPKPGEEDKLRGFEWYLLARRLYQARMELNADSPVYSITYSTDGKKIAAACEDGSAKLWETMTGKELLTIKVNGAVLWTIAFSPDGQSVATGGDDRVIRLRDATDGREIASWKSSVGPISAIAFSPDGKKLLAGGYGVLMLIDIVTGNTLVIRDRNLGAIFTVAFLRDGQRFVSGGENGRLSWWNADDGRWLFSTSPHPGHYIFSLAVSSDGRRLASSGGDWTAKIWDAATGGPIATFTGHASAVRGVAFSPDDRRLVTASADRTVRLWEIETREEIAIFRGHTDRIRGVAFSPDGRSVASGGDEQTIKIWDVTAKEKASEILRGYNNRIFSIAFSPDGKRLATAGGHITQSLSSAELKIAKENGDNIAKVWDITTGRVVTELRGHNSELRSVAFSPDGRRLATASADRTIRIWDAITGRQLSAHRQPNVGPVASVAFSPNGGLLAEGYDGGGIILRDIEREDGAILHKWKFGAPVWSVRFSSDSKLLAAASWDRVAKIWDVASGRELCALKDQNKPITAVAFSPDDRLIATGSDSHAVKLWEVATGRLLFTLEGHADQVLSVAFSPDGRRLVSGSADRTIRIWDVETGQELLTLRGHKDEIWSVAFSPDGKILASGSWDKTVRLWYADGH